MARLSFALLAAHLGGVSVETLAARLELPPDWVAERIEAARLCLLIGRPRTLTGGVAAG